MLIVFRLDNMMIVAGDYTLNNADGTEQYEKPRRLITHPLYNRTTNDNDLMLIKVPNTPLCIFSTMTFRQLDQLLYNCTVYSWTDNIRVKPEGTHTNSLVPCLCLATSPHRAEQVRLVGTSTQTGDRCGRRSSVSGVWVGLQQSG